MKVILDIEDDKAIHLMEVLKDLPYVKTQSVLNEAKAPITMVKLSDKYKGVFTKEDAKHFNEHTQKMRKEWKNI